jgi:hypothetical protein
MSHETDPRHADVAPLGSADAVLLIWRATRYSLQLALMLLELQAVSNDRTQYLAYNKKIRYSNRPALGNPCRLLRVVHGNVVPQVLSWVIITSKDDSTWDRQDKVARMTSEVLNQMLGTRIRDEIEVMNVNRQGNT